MNESKHEQLEELISQGKSLTISTYQRATENPFTGIISNRTMYTEDNPKEYCQWKEDVKRFIKLHYPSDFTEFEKLLGNLAVHDTIIAKLIAIKKMEAINPITIDTQSNAVVHPINKKIFIVHGHDDAMKLAVESFLKQMKLEPIILNNQVSRSQTVIEKLEANSDVGFAVVLLSPCDKGCTKDSDDFKPRARQNVILELGYFIGYLGRKKVSVLKKSEVEEPSDFTGIIYTTFDAQGGWKFDLAKELTAAGYSVDLNETIRDASN